MWEKIKHVRAYVDRREVFTSILIMCVSGISFVLGQLSVLDTKPLPVTVEMLPSEEMSQNTSSIVMTGNKEVVSTPKPKEQITESTSIKKYVASKSGKKYHLPTCLSAQKISEKNKIWFATKEEAEQAGFSPASDCKGL